MRGGFIEMELTKIFYIWTFLFLSGMMIGTPGGTAYADVGGGQKMYEAKGCGSCHMTKGPNTDKSFEDKLSHKGPDLWFAGSKFKKEWLAKWLQAPKPIRTMAYNSIEKKNAGDHPKLSGKEADDVTDYLMTLTSKDVVTGTIKAKNDLMGKMVFEKKQGCYGCHLSKRGAKVAGGVTGPSLVDAGQRLQGDWIYTYLSKPQAVIPVKRMPTYSGVLTDAELKGLAAYVSNF